LSVLASDVRYRVKKRRYHDVAELFMNDTPTLFNNDSDYSYWKPTSAELAIAVELNTIGTFRTQFRRLKTRFKDFASMMGMSYHDLDIFTDWADSNKELLLERIGELRFGTEFDNIPDQISIITWFDQRYPKSLRDIYDPPPVLYVKGDISYDYSSAVSIVGTRNMTEYGRSAAEMFSYQLGSWGFTVISGGARGIDSVAHQSCIDAGGRTFAVLGCGLDVIFPVENKKLFEEIARSGAVVGEFPMGTIPEKYNFPARNRIIAGLGRGTIVVEAPEKSGALITADLSLQNHREIFAIPGRITDGRSVGANQLIRDGAHIALDPMDIAIRFGLTVVESDDTGSPDPAERLEGDEAIVYSLTGLEARDADEITRESGLSSSRILSALLILQTRGLIKELPGGRFVRPVLSLAKKPSPGSSYPGASADDPGSSYPGASAEGSCYPGL